MRTLLPLLALCACNADPGDPDKQVGYRDLLQGGATSGERGSVIISEILWSGSLRNQGGNFVWDPEDVFVEIRNQGTLPVNVTGWHLELDGPLTLTWRLPDIERLEVGRHAFFAAKRTGCFPDADGFIDDMRFPPLGDPIELTLRDADERLIEPAGSEYAPPYAGGYDLVVSRSMERIELMFGDGGMSPHVWHHNTDNEPVDVPNDDLVAADCRERTYASPGRPNSPDYSGAFASGGFE